MSIAALLLFACKKNSDSAAAEEINAAAKGKPVIFAAEPEYDFGKVKQGVDVEHIYKIKNTGKADLVIERTSGS
jgi:hypothetical protein